MMIWSDHSVWSVLTMNGQEIARVHHIHDEGWFYGVGVGPLEGDPVTEREDAKKRAEAAVVRVVRGES